MGGPVGAREDLDHQLLHGGLRRRRWRATTSSSDSLGRDVPFDSNLYTAGNLLPLMLSDVDSH